jgi:hypothetical protein
MPKYKGVHRLITIYISKAKEGSKYAIDLCPDPAEIIAGDTVQWKVQNPPHGVKVTVGNFRRVEPAPNIVLRRGRPPLVKERTFEITHSSGLQRKMGNGDVGFHKYDIRFDKDVVLDPEIEVRPPRGV